VRRSKQDLLDRLSKRKKPMPPNQNIPVKLNLLVVLASVCLPPLSQPLWKAFEGSTKKASSNWKLGPGACLGKNAKTHGLAAQALHNSSSEWSPSQLSLLSFH
jgi:hypothetical protein